MIAAGFAEQLFEAVSRSESGKVGVIAEAMGWEFEDVISVGGVWSDRDCLEFGHDSDFDMQVRVTDVGRGAFEKVFGRELVEGGAK